LPVGRLDVLQKGNLATEIGIGARFLNRHDVYGNNMYRRIEGQLPLTNLKPT
jgi:hypothetical protein